MPQLQPLDEAPRLRRILARPPRRERPADQLPEQRREDERKRDGNGVADIPGEVATQHRCPRQERDDCGKEPEPHGRARVGVKDDERGKEPGRKVTPHEAVSRKQDEADDEYNEVCGHGNSLTIARLAATRRG